MIDLESYLQQSEPNSELLFHYTAPLTAVAHVLPEQKLIFTSLKLSHDPIEFEDLDYSAYSGAAGDKRVVTEQLDSLVRKGSRENEIIKKFFKIACFCRDRESQPHSAHFKGCNRSMMWSHYAKGHGGVCLVFKRTDLISEVQRQIGADGLVLSSDMDYTNDLRKLEAVVNLGPADGVVSAEDRIKMNSKYLLFTKLMDFQNENEFRICFWKRQQTQQVDREFIDIGKAIIGILLGSSFPEPFARLITLQARDMNLPVFQVFWLHGMPLWVDTEKKKALLR